MKVLIILELCGMINFNTVVKEFIIESKFKFVKKFL